VLPYEGRALRPHSRRGGDLNADPLQTLTSCAATLSLAGDAHASPGTGTAPAPQAAHIGRWWLLASSVLILLAALFPYLCAVFGTPASVHFWGGTCFYHDDGLLLSVMREGMQGHWLHSPPYAGAQGPGALFYPGYLLLGHLCAWAALDPVPVFYLARLVCGVVLLASLWHFIGRFFARPEDRRFSFLLAATGCGLAWAWLMTSRFRLVELRASELHPFFSILSSPHLALAMAAFFWVLDALVPRENGPVSASGRIARLALFVAGVLILALSQPFGSVVAAGIAALWACKRWLQERRPPMAELGKLATLGILTIPFATHQVVTIASNPAYLGWRTQVHSPNLTPWGFLIALGLPLPLALVGVVMSARRRRPCDWLLLFWTGVVALLVSLPYYQSRRFDLGVGVLVSILAVRGVAGMGLRLPAVAKLAAIVVNALTGVLLLGAMTQRIASLSPDLFVEHDVWQAVRFLREHAPERAVVLAEPATSMCVLASAPLKVVYGHPAETPNGAAVRRAVEGFFERGTTLEESLMDRVEYILLQPHRDKRPACRIPEDFGIAFQASDVRVYARRPRGSGGQLATVASCGPRRGAGRGNSPAGPGDASSRFRAETNVRSLSHPARMHGPAPRPPRRVRPR